MSTLFSKPRIPVPPLPQPPAPVKNTQLEAQLSQLGRRQGLVAAMFGYKNPSTTGGPAAKISGGMKTKTGE